jgi:outer membrane protein TolC
MRLSGLVITLLLVCNTPVLPQIKITLEDAISLAMKNNPELLEQQSGVAKKMIELTDAERFPNPSMNFSWENLSSSGETAGEWVVGGSMPLNFLWERKYNIESKRKLIDAQKLLLEQAKRDLAFRLRKAYLNYHYHTQLVRIYDSTVVLFEEITRSSEWKLSAGDISHYELQRIKMETKKYKNDLKLLKQRRDTFFQELCMLTGSQPGNEYWVTDPIEMKELFLSEKEIADQALTKRIDIQIIQKFIESEMANLSYGESKKFPEINLGIGYKRQYDNFAGPVIQLDVEVPLFSRNKKEIDLANEELRNLGLQKQMKSDMIITQIKFAFNKYQMMLNSFKTDKIESQNEILDIALISYAKGELSLVEFMDGVRAFVDGARLNSELYIDLLQSQHELEYVSGFNEFTEN